MATLLQKSKVMKVAGLSLVVLLAACSSDQRYKRQVSGDEEYLNAAPLKMLNAPQGITLPEQNGEFDIPKATSTGAIGKALDIRPPVLTISQLSGSRTEDSANASRLLLENTPENSALWSQVTLILEQRGIPVSSKDDGSHSIETNWVKWDRADEDVAIESRHKITVQPENNMIALTVTNLGMQQGTESITDAAEMQRYNKLLLNELTDNLFALRDTSNKNSIQNAYGIIDVQTGSDTTGLPLVIVRAPFDAVWERLPHTLENVGMKVGDRSRSTGSVMVTYKGLSSSEWQALGVDDPSVPEADYKIQVGDLNNRSSLQFINTKGVPLTQKQNDEMVAALKAAFSKVAPKK
ncbi:MULTISPECIES: outer membrane protein assembly factor BamC [unclassified Providencia]|uniref:outer membrane protein assembly factor BamC n=1 Tax=unclassified Providencia TaxID=2633465 RepID=UPI000E833AAC|nr:outer membrane protein assembly factor BamC [Providencia sp.]MBP6080528.1 outer membrane protein assembly factor BamC [Providencia sp.]HBO22870.1 outer membrane protein assembly factor BamC [Providencia sp.]